MRFRFHKLCLAAALLGAAPTGAALASPAVADNTASPPAEATPAVSATGEKRAEYGVGFRLRSVRAPRGMLELFVDNAPGSVSNVGLGVDLVRRKGNVELQLGFEFEHIQPPEGAWIERNSNVANGDEADFILSPKHNNNQSLGWFTVEFTFLSHAEITKHVAIRYGGGAGLGIVTGSLGRYDVFCNGATNDSPEPGCTPATSPFNGNASPGGDNPAGFEIVQYNLPPVFPVVNAIIGVQIRPIEKMTINVEGGIRTFPFFGVSGGYFF